jgi:hypothetical protein
MPFWLRARDKAKALRGNPAVFLHLDGANPDAGR